MHKYTQLMTIFCLFNITALGSSSNNSPSRSSDNAASLKSTQFSQNSLDAQESNNPLATPVRTSKRRTNDPYAWGRQLLRDRKEQQEDDDEQPAIVTNSPYYRETSIHQILEDLIETQSAETVIDFIALQSKDYLNKPDNKGQTAAHKLTPIHWLEKVIDKSISNGINFTASTDSRDLHPGSTLAHNVAGMLLSRNKKINHLEHIKTDDPNRIIERENLIIKYKKFNQKSLICLHQLSKIDNASHFNTIAEESNMAFAHTVWDLLYRSNHLNKFLEELKDHTHVPPHYQNAPKSYIVSKQRKIR